MNQTDLEIRYFEGDSRQVGLARELFAGISELPLVCPHGHVDPRLFSDPGYRFGSPVDLLILPDHYIQRMLYSQGIQPESLGLVPVQSRGFPVETDHRTIWQSFANNFRLYAGTPSGIWFKEILQGVFGIDQKLGPATAETIYDKLANQLEQAAFHPRVLFKRFNIDVLCTTDGINDSLEHHSKIRADWDGRVLPTFRPDNVVNPEHPDWQQQIDTLGRIVGHDIDSCSQLLDAIRSRREFFIAHGAKAADHGISYLQTDHLPLKQAEKLFARCRTGRANSAERRSLAGHLLFENALMSLEDGLVMQLHVGVARNHNPQLFGHFGPDRGADLPLPGEFIHNLKTLLDHLGNNPKLKIILFTLDESSYSRELAPLAGHYPCLRVGPPWWFHDSPNGMRRYFDQIMETAGLYNTVGFNDDTRAFCSIPVRHDLWRRAACSWLAGLQLRQIIDAEDARTMAGSLASGLAKTAYNLGETV